MGETILEWQTPEHHHVEKQMDWFWILGIMVVGAVVLAFYFGNTLFGIFIAIAGLALGVIHWKGARDITVRITDRSIVFGKYEYHYTSCRSFWIKEDHLHGPRILIHPARSFLPLMYIPIADNVDLEELRDVLNNYIDEEYLEESIIHHFFDKLGL